MKLVIILALFGCCIAAPCYGPGPMTGKGAYQPGPGYQKGYQPGYQKGYAPGGYAPGCGGQRYHPGQVGQPMYAPRPQPQYQPTPVYGGQQKYGPGPYAPGPQKGYNPGYNPQKGYMPGKKMM